MGKQLEEIENLPSLTPLGSSDKGQIGARNYTNDRDSAWQGSAGQENAEEMLSVNASTQVVADKDVMWKGFVSFAQSHLHVIARFCISRSAKTGNCSTSAESAVASLAEDVDDGFEGEPLRDLLVGSQSSSELGAGQL
eukprot:CAMPEP_0206448142 /NCGR_PEP_ID=MMETSP0324_2-20121206/17265_1 /ASSEMBLY_ACC=CAM_ASM_000836 /TAXON_ID=2866 /ORGANISM="Crypthecodinium cohnii, Strain Seligo" /LENGTH=137 /DNA_ID=CAMNT_0053917167 /DNA_START=135 /DNA_END=547 /DNA_ORIENTATION=+